jgi:hypothetical protein
LRPDGARPPWWIGSLVVPVLAAACDVWACPVCDTETGALVRAGIFDGRFVPTLLAVAAPFPVLVAAVAWLRVGLSPS